MGKDSWVWLPASVTIVKKRVQRRKREQGHHRTRESLGLVGQPAYLKETMTQVRDRLCLKKVPWRVMKGTAMLSSALTHTWVHTWVLPQTSMRGHVQMCHGYHLQPFDVVNKTQASWGNRQWLWN